jgi:septal ring factor EnvC (AmiA/AmiB activator)
VGVDDIGSISRMSLLSPALPCFQAVLNSETAIHINIQIMRTFIKLREIRATHKDLQHEIEQMEKKMEEKFGVYDEQFKIVFRAFEEIKVLLNPQIEKRKRKIGFHSR